MIKQAPVALIVVFLLGATTSWLAIRFIYKERIEGFKERIADLQERLGFSPRDKTAYSRFTNAELRQVTADFVEKLHSFHQTSEAESAKIFDMMRRPADSKEESRRLWVQQSNRLSELSSNQRLEYNRNFRADATLLRDELLTRLPGDQRKPIHHFFYDSLVGPNPLLEIALDLDRLSKLLPRR